VHAGVRLHVGNRWERGEQWKFRHCATAAPTHLSKGPKKRLMRARVSGGMSSRWRGAAAPAAPPSEGAGERMAARPSVLCPAEEQADGAVGVSGVLVHSRHEQRWQPPAAVARAACEREQPRPPVTSVLLFSR